MTAGLAQFIGRVLSNKNKDLFTVRLGTSLMLSRIGLVGFMADIVGYFVRGFIGLIMEDGTYQIDIRVDAYKEGAKLKEFQTQAEAEYKKATAKIYDEAKKNEIRQEYLKIIALIGNVGNGPSKP